MNILMGLCLIHATLEAAFLFVYFDLTKQELDIKDGTTKLTFKYELSGTVTNIIAELRRPEGQPSGAPYSYGKEKEIHELIFSWLSWLAVLLVVAYARRRRRRSRAPWRPYSK